MCYCWTSRPTTSMSTRCDRWFLDRIATHILSFEGDSKVVYYEGSYSEYEAWKKAQGGDTAPHRVKYKKLMA